MKRVRNILNRIMVLLLLIFVLQLSLVQVTEANQAETITAYPTTPEGVVEAFCKEDFNGAGLDIATWKNILQYTTEKDRVSRIDSVKVTKKPKKDKVSMINSVVIVYDYKVTKIKETSNTAEVKIEFDTAGELFGHPFGWEWRNMNKVGETYILNLIKQNGYWRIKGSSELVFSQPIFLANLYRCCNQHISIDVAIKRLESDIVSWREDKSSEMEFRKQVVSILKKYKENPNNLIPFILSSYNLSKQQYIAGHNLPNQRYFKRRFQPKTNDLTTYPITPDSVVEAYLKEDFDMGEWEKREKYTVYGVVAPKGETTIVSEYKITTIKKNIDAAWIKADYAIGGYFTRSEAGFHFRDTDKVEEAYIFEVVKNDGVWQIKSPMDHQYVLLISQIKSLEKFVTEEKELMKEVEQTKKIIDILKKHLKN